MRILLTLLLSFVFPATLLADVYVANSGAASVTVHATNATGNAAPLRTISGAATNLNSPEGIAVDTVNSTLYVADFSGQAVRVYALGATGNVAPLRTLIEGPNSNILQPRAVAVDTVNNEIYVTSINDSIRVFSRTASGDAVPIRVISGANTLLSNPISIALDLTNNELIVDSYDVGGVNVAGILVFSRTANGNVAPLRSIAGSNTLMGTYTNHVALDLANNEIYAQGNSGQGIVVFARTASGNVAPLRNITGPATGLSNIGGILPDVANNRVIVSQLTPINQLLVFARTADANAAPLMSVSGTATGLSDPFSLAMDTSGGFTAGGAVGAPTSIPTLSEWGMIILFRPVGLGCCGFSAPSAE